MWNENINNNKLSDWKLLSATQFIIMIMKTKCCSDYFCWLHI